MPRTDGREKFWNVGPRIFHKLRYRALQQLVAVVALQCFAETCRALRMRSSVPPLLLLLLFLLLLGQLSQLVFPSISIGLAEEDILHGRAFFCWLSSRVCSVAWGDGIDFVAHGREEGTNERVPAGAGLVVGFTHL